LPEPSILLCGPAAQTEESAASLDLLRQVGLPNAVKYLVTTGKFDSEGAAKTVNVEGDYPADTAYLQTLLRWAEIRDLHDPRFRDGYDLYCLRRIIARFKGSDYAVLLRNGATAFERQWPKLQKSIRGRLFQTFGRSTAARGQVPGKNLIVDLKDERCADFLDAAWELYATGAVYGINEYSLDFALGTALDALRVERMLRQAAERASPVSATGTQQAADVTVLVSLTS